YVAALENSPGAAQREAALALWHGADEYLVLHNVACVYAALSRVEKGQAGQHQDLAVDLLRRADQLCRRRGQGDREVWNMQSDQSLKALWGRPDFRKLSGAGGE